MKSSSDPAAGKTRLAVSAGVASVLVAGVLVALKLWALAETGALSIAASLADSALDLIMSLAAAAAKAAAEVRYDHAHLDGYG